MEIFRLACLPCLLGPWSDDRQVWIKGALAADLKSRIKAGETGNCAASWDPVPRAGCQL